MYLLYISKTKIEVFKNKVKISEVSWTNNNLIDVLSRLKVTFSSHFRVLLTDDFISITSILVSRKESKKRKTIQAKIQPIIAQNLDQTVWDYKIVANLEKLKLAQIIYLDKEFFNQFRSAVYSVKLKIKLIESLSTSICRFLPKNKLVFLLFRNLIVISYNQTPIYSKTLNKKLTQEDIGEIFNYTKDRFKTFPQQIIFSPTGDTAFTHYDFSGLTPEYLDINPIGGLIHSPNISGSDDSTSRLEIKNSSPIILDQTFPIKKVIIGLVLCIITVLFLIFRDNALFLPNKDHLDPSSSITPTISLTPSPTVSLASLKIKVLNGSGITGQAAKVTELLAQNKFNVSQTSNASNYDFVTTEIQVKKSVVLSVTDLLIKSLEKEYTSTISATKLDDLSEYDIIITTGKPL
jgi:hypothetical protein